MELLLDKNLFWLCSSSPSSCCRMVSLIRINVGVYKGRSPLARIALRWVGGDGGGV